MGHVVWSDRPRLKRPVLLTAFEGWNDAGDAATLAAKFLGNQWSARPFATIDSEEFFDFTSTRPQVRLDAGQQREIVWPSTELSAAAMAGASQDTVILIGTEPQLRWRTFCAEIIDVARELDVRMVVTLGALLADVPHSRPVQVVGTAADQGLIDRLGLQRSRYEGPTGIVGVLHDAFRTAGIPAASLWAAVPTYVPNAPSPKAALALVQRLADLLAIPVRTTELEIAAASYERQLDEVVADDSDTADYVARLEEAVDRGEPDDDDDPVVVEEGTHDPARLIEEVERFLRDQPPNP